MSTLSIIGSLIELGGKAVELVLAAKRAVSARPSAPEPADESDAPLPVVTAGSDYVRGITEQQRKDALLQAQERMTGDARAKLGKEGQ